MLLWGKETRGQRHVTVGKETTYAASKLTGSLTQFPPSSKYLKQPVRRTSSTGSSAGACQRGGRGVRERNEEHTRCREQLVQRDTKDVHCRREGFACPVPLVENAADLAPVCEVLHVQEQVAEDDDVVEGDGHAAAGEGMPHVPRVAEEDDAILRMLALL